MLHTQEVFACIVLVVQTLILSIPRSPIQVMNRLGLSVFFSLLGSMRAIRCRYDPYIQTRTRVEQLRRLGHR